VLVLKVIGVATERDDHDRAAELDSPSAGERGIPFDAVCTGCGKVRVKRADEDSDNPTSFKHVCHRCKTATWWNPIRTLTGLMRMNDHPAVEGKMRAGPEVARHERPRWRRSERHVPTVVTVHTFVSDLQSRIDYCSFELFARAIDTVGARRILHPTPEQ